MEIGTIRYKTNERRIKDWGLHCEWPPKWVQIPASVKEFTRGNIVELEEIYQGAFQRKVMEALEGLYGITTEALSLGELMEASREHWFWIQDDGTVVLPRGLWLGE